VSPWGPWPRLHGQVVQPAPRVLHGPRGGVLPQRQPRAGGVEHAHGLVGELAVGEVAVGEAHGRAQMMEFNFLSQEKAILRDPSTGRYGVDHARIPAAVAKLARELLEMEAAGDRVRAEAWFKKYGVMPTDLKTSLQGAKDVPVDLDPVFSFRVLPK